MYKNRKFLIFATVCFGISTLAYALAYKSLSFEVILNAILFLTCFCLLLINLKSKSNSIKKSEETKVNK